MRCINCKPVFVWASMRSLKFQGGEEKEETQSKLQDDTIDESSRAAANDECPCGNQVATLMLTGAVQ